MTLNEVLKEVPFKRSTLYKLISEDKFPRQLNLGTNMARWHRDDINKWKNSIRHKH
ncbi:MAG: AlpA family phage regulatory protein [Candidatus Thiodiazotropha taylori]